MREKNCKGTWCPARKLFLSLASSNYLCQNTVRRILPEVRLNDDVLVFLKHQENTALLIERGVKTSHPNNPEIKHYHYFSTLLASVTRRKLQRFTKQRNFSLPFHCALRALVRLNFFHSGTHHEYKARNNVHKARSLPFQMRHKRFYFTPQ